MVKSGVSILTLFSPTTPKMLVRPEPTAEVAILRTGAGWTATTGVTLRTGAALIATAGVGLNETAVCLPDEMAAWTAPLI